MLILYWVLSHSFFKNRRKFMLIQKMTKLLKTETFSTVWSSFFYFPFHITVSLPYYLLWIVNQLRCNLISLSTQPCVQTLVYRVKGCAWVIIFRMEKQLLLSARKVTTCLEIRQFVVMVECGTVKHQNAKVMYENKPNKENKYSNYANTYMPNDWMDMWHV